MVARAASPSKPTFRGARLFNSATDMYGVARVLEEAFRPDNNFPFSNIAWLRELGILLWTLNFAPGFPEPSYGFVWIEDNKIVGNITISPDRNRNDHYYFSNVAVKLEYRRQGIARALVQQAIGFSREQRANLVYLNVRPNNTGATKLYQELGFCAIETRGDWSLRTIPSRNAEQPRAELRPMRLSDGKNVAELVKVATPNTTRPFGSPRNEFEPGADELIWEAIVDLFTAQLTQRYVLERENKLAAAMFIRGQRVGSPHKLAVQVHPDFRGRVEDELLDSALSELAQLPPREIRAHGTTTHPQWIDALERNGFKFSNGLTLMELTLSS